MEKELHQYRAKGTINFLVEGIIEECAEHARERFQDPALLESELMAADDQGTFKVDMDTLEIEDLGPAKDTD